jgi:hypothetical protein
MHGSPLCSESVGACGGRRGGGLCESVGACGGRRGGGRGGSGGHRAPLGEREAPVAADPPGTPGCPSLVALRQPPYLALVADAQWVVPNSDANKRLYGKSGPQLALVTATISHILQKERSDAGMHDTASRPQQSGHTGHTTCMQQPATAGIPPTSCRTPSKQWLGAACCG